jgi:low temperature requirement protein LtrA
MIGFASESANFIPREFKSGEVSRVTAFFTINLILLISRAALAIDYLVPLWFFWRKRQQAAVLPLALCSGIFLVSVIVYTGLLWTFSETHLTRVTYRAWYGLLAFEVVAMFAISCIWRVLSFKNTHVVKRMGSLTLIILGEGILNMATQFSQIVKSRGWSGTVFGQTLSVIIIIVSFFPVD